jgi:hypothetical protein
MTAPDRLRPAEWTAWFVMLGGWVLLFVGCSLSSEGRGWGIMELLGALIAMLGSSSLFVLASRRKRSVAQRPLARSGSERS